MLLARSGRDVGQTKYEKQDMYIYICVFVHVCVMTEAEWSAAVSTIQK